MIWYAFFDEQENDAKTESIRNFNRAIMGDSRVSVSMVHVSQNHNSNNTISKYSAWDVVNYFIKGWFYFPCLTGADRRWHDNMQKKIKSFVTEF